MRAGDFVVMASSSTLGKTATSIRTIEEIGPASIRLSPLFDKDSHSSKNWWKKEEFFKAFKPYENALSDIFTLEYAPSPAALAEAFLKNTSQIRNEVLNNNDVPAVLKEVLSIPNPLPVNRALTPPRPEGWIKNPKPRSYEERVAIISRRETEENLRTLEMLEKYSIEQVDNRALRLKKIEDLKKLLNETPISADEKRVQTDLALQEKVKKELDEEEAAG